MELHKRNADTPPSVRTNGEIKRVAKPNGCKPTILEEHCNPRQINKPMIPMQQYASRSRACPMRTHKRRQACGPPAGRAWRTRSLASPNLANRTDACVHGTLRPPLPNIPQPSLAHPALTNTKRPHLECHLGPLRPNDLRVSPGWRAQKVQKIKTAHALQPLTRSNIPSTWRASRCNVPRCMSHRLRASPTAKSTAHGPHITVAMPATVPSSTWGV